MRNLLAFLSRYSITLLFLVLEGAALYLVFQYNDLQNSIVLNRTTEVTGTVRSWMNGVRSYMHLKTSNDSLMAENIRLRSLLPDAYLADTATWREKLDSLGRRQYAYYPARAVYNSTFSRDNFLVIDAGHNRLPRSKRMGVIGPQGIVGITTEKISSNFTSVLSVLNSRFQLSTTIEELNETGDLSWAGGDPQYATLRNVNLLAKVKKGQKVVTSRYTRLFPYGVPVGVVEGVEVKKSDPFFTIRVKLSTDFSNVNEVYVVDNLLSAERDSVEANTGGQR